MTKLIVGKIIMTKPNMAKLKMVKLTSEQIFNIYAKYC